jgi:hypothetical protein
MRIAAVFGHISSSLRAAAVSSPSLKKISLSKLPGSFFAPGYLNTITYSNIVKTIT